MAFVAAIAAGMSAINSIAQGNASKAAADYNANINDQNAGISNARTATDVAAMRRDQMRNLGAIRASAGASGVRMEGSPLDVFDNSVVESELDILNRRYSGELESMGFRQSAELERTSGRTARNTARFSAAATLLGAGANYYQKSSPGNSVRVTPTNARNQIW